MRIIKRTKITVIRTETVFLRNQDGGSIKEILLLQTNDLPGLNNENSILEIETIKQIEKQITKEK